MKATLQLEKKRHLLCFAIFLQGVFNKNKNNNDHQIEFIMRNEVMK